MKNIIFMPLTNLSAQTSTLLLLLFFASNLKAQIGNSCRPNCTTPMVNLSTGFNHSTNAVYAAGQPEGYWELVSVPSTSGYLVPRPAFTILPYVGWSSPNSAASTWISGEPTASWSTNNTTIPYVFERCFCTCNIPATVSQTLNITVWADDRTDLSLWEGGTNTSLLAQTVTGWSGTNISKNLGTLKSNTKYCLRAGLYNTGPTAMGLRIEGSVSGGTFSKPNCCEAKSKIIGFKYEDKNCDGQFNLGEVELSGWTIQLILGGLVVATSITDAGGYYAFNDVAPGTYEIKEINQTGWTPNSPITGSYTGVVVAANQVLQYNFGNCKKTPQPPGKTCCPELENLIQNGDFAQPISAGSSQYALESNPLSINSTLPGEYGLANGAAAVTICDRWKVQDHTTCNSATGQFMLVNGETTQLINANNIIWQQTIAGLEKDATYKFCSFMKNLPVCCFDVLPKVKIEVVGGSASSAWITVNAGSGVCDWQQLSHTFQATATSVTIKILLEETTDGDGNDLALDDFSLNKLNPAIVQFSATNTSTAGNTGCEITASINSIGTGDDNLPASGCKYAWAIGKWSTSSNIYSPAFLGSFSLGGSIGFNWPLTTTFTPGFSCAVNTPYLIYLYVYDCDCQADGSDYQILFNSGKMEKLSADKEKIIRQKLAETIRKKVNQQ